jgi:peptidyl-tRNA hydrolase
MANEEEPLRMYLVVRRGAIADLARAGELAGAAAVACVRGVASEAEYVEALAAWRPRPGKVCLRARNAAQWQQVLELPHALAGDPVGEAVAALPPLPRSLRPPLLERLQAMSTELEAAPARADPADRRSALSYLLNPSAPMTSGKSVAQVAHAAVLAADTGGLERWLAAGCPGRVLAPDPAAFAAVAGRDDLAARVVDAGLTEVAPGTVTVLALLPPGPASALPDVLLGR